MASKFRYEDRGQVHLPNPMSIDKSIIRTSLIPSLLNVYDYNKKRKVKDVYLYEIAKTYDKEYIEDSKITGLLTGKYLTNDWSQTIKIDFYIVKGIIENLLDYMGFQNRYSFEKSDCKDLHPGISADILIDHKKIGIFGRVHPSIIKEEVYVFELSLQALMIKTKPIKFKEAPKYPAIEKDLAFIIDKNISAGEVETVIKKAGGRLLTDVKIFDVYTGENVPSDKKSIAYNLTFQDDNRTLTDEEVMTNFNKIIDKVVSTFKAELRDK